MLGSMEMMMRQHDKTHSNELIKVKGHLKLLKKSMLEFKTKKPNLTIVEMLGNLEKKKSNVSK